MNKLASKSCTIAWFKIADFVARGEKERALSVYRLLMHSVDEPAISYQLEGDILRAFGDVGAIARYQVAADLYKKSGKMQEAVSLYERIAFFKYDQQIFKILVDDYIAMGRQVHLLDLFSRLATFLIFQGHQDQVVAIFQYCCQNLDKKFQALLYPRLIKVLLLHGDIPVAKYVDQALDIFLEILAINHDHEKIFQKFLADLKSLSQSEYARAQGLLKK